MKKKGLIFVIIVGIFASILLYTFSTSYAVVLENDVRVAENSDLTYYLDVIYDGKDKNVVMSSDTATADVKSDYIYVEDKIPDGLIFKEFVNTSDGSIGAVERGDNSKSCIGNVVDGYDGLNYDEDTRLVSFKIKNLQAGCKITVGIVTTTPELKTATRMDFYNTAFAKEGTFSAKSNTVHVFMGQEDATLYNVTYQYTGDIPDNAPTLPEASSYASGTSVGVLNNITIDGYYFNGWKSSDVTISNNSFTMPEKNVVLEGSFTKKDTYKVSYSITGDAPNGYIPPKTKSYGLGDDVVIDSLKEGDEINGYRFLGWFVEDFDLSEGVISMPGMDLELVGKFEKISYKVTYKFQGTIIPDNADSLLPKEKSYYPNDTVTLANDPVTSGYKFLGWYSAKSFEMPEEDIVIYGEWMLQNGVFAPTITKSVVNEKVSYQEGEKVEFQTTVTNTANYSINDIRLEENTDGSYFISGDGYEVLSNSIVNIPTIPAGSSVVVKSEYIATDEYQKSVVNEVELTGALASNNYYLDTKKEYKSTASFLIFNPILKINKIDKNNNPLAGYEFGLYSDKDGGNLISKGIVFDNLEVGKTYYLKELVAPSGYAKSNKTLTVVVSKKDISIDGYDVRVEDNMAVVDVVNTKIGFITSPNTLDSIVIYTILFVVSAIIVVGIILYLKKKRKHIKGKNGKQCREVIKKNKENKGIKD